MTLIFRLLFIAAAHFIFFISYPDTGPYGNYFLCASMLAWAGVMTALSGSLKFLALISFGVRIVLNLAVFFLIILSIAAAMPQKDKTSVLKKIRGRQFPTAASVRTGLARFGIKLEEPVKAGIKDLGSEINSAVKKTEKRLNKGL